MGNQLWLATALRHQKTERNQFALRKIQKALDNGMTSIEVKEIVYQATDYLGYGRILAFLHATNDILSERGVELPLEGQATTGSDNRLEKGIEAQAEIFGAHMREAWKAGHINRWLAANCFGDYYTRKGLDAYLKKNRQPYIESCIFCDNFSLLFLCCFLDTGKRIQTARVPDVWQTL